MTHDNQNFTHVTDGQKKTALPLPEFLPCADQNNKPHHSSMKPKHPIFLVELEEELGWCWRFYIDVYMCIYIDYKYV